MQTSRPGSNQGVFQKEIIHATKFIHFHFKRRTKETLTFF